MKNLNIAIAGIWLILTLCAAGTSHGQTCNDNIIASTPNSDFSLNTNGTVVHNATGLIWMRCMLGQNYENNDCSGNHGEYAWQEALHEAQVHGFAGFSDWRLPNIKELESIVEEKCFDPAINSEIFPNTALSGFWTSSPDKEEAQRVWIIHFEHGIIGFGIKSDKMPVRLVRDGQ